MRVRYWGTRGSIPTPGPSTVRYGGNTVCVEVRSDSGHLLVLDCGSGARGLGKAILSEPNRPRRINILLSHTHWDHIQGFPFFSPAFASGFEVHIYGPSGTSLSLEQSIAGQMDPTYFPISIDHLASKLHFHDLAEETFRIGDFDITSRYLNHTAPTVGFRIECNGRTVVYSTDHEPPGRFWHAWEGHRERGKWGAEADLDTLTGHIELTRGADLLLHDSQFVEAEYPSRRGWGHSTVEYATDLAIRAGVKRLVLFHHDPAHNDRFVDQALEQARSMVEAAGAQVDVVAAMEGGVECLIEDPHPASDTAAVFLPAESADELGQLRTIGLFERIDAPDLQIIRGSAETRRFPPNATIIEQGEIAPGVSVVIAGLVEANAQVSLLSYALELPLTVLGAGATFGELAVLDAVASPATYTAVGEVELLAIDRQPFLTLLEDRPHVALRVISVMARELKRHDEIVRRVLVDPVSGAFTRVAHEEYYRREAVRIQRRGGYITLLSLTLDGLGQPGEPNSGVDPSSVLGTVAHAIQVASRQTDLNSRYGWSEFVTLLVDTDERGGWVVADRVNRILSELPDLPAQLRWSIGIGSQQAGDTPLDVLVSQAQQGVR